MLHWRDKNDCERSASEISRILADYYRQKMYKERVFQVKPIGKRLTNNDRFFFECRERVIM